MSRSGADGPAGLQRQDGEQDCLLRGQVHQSIANGEARRSEDADPHDAAHDNDTGAPRRRNRPGIHCESIPNRRRVEGRLLGCAQVADDHRHGVERDGRHTSNQLWSHTPARSRKRSSDGWQARTRRCPHPVDGLRRRDPDRGRVVLIHGSRVDGGRRLGRRRTERTDVPARIQEPSQPGVPVRPQQGGAGLHLRPARHQHERRPGPPRSRAAPSPSEAGRPLAAPSHAPLEPALGPASCRRRAEIVARPSRCASPSVLRWHEPEDVEGAKPCVDRP